MKNITNDNVAYWVMVELNTSNLSTHLYAQTVKDCISSVSYKKDLVLSPEDSEIVFDKVMNALKTIQNGGLNQ
jgi:putative IMPACT (imprinted ancient) family translation regulator